ncbi:hypothetical protein CsatB_010231 [Cannabis sativa]
MMAILSIPLSSSVHEDSWYRSFKKLGLYTVKSAYRYLDDLKNGFSTDNSAGFWKKIWALNIPPKVRNFIWRAASNVGPTCAQLVTKHVPISSICQLCNSSDETIFHALVGCSFARSCWHRSCVDIGSWMETAFSSWWYNLSHKVSEPMLEEANMVAWGIWRARNDVVWNQKSSNDAVVVLSARRALDQYQFAQSTKNDSLMFFRGDDKVVEHWKTPNFNQIKVNVDGAIFEQWGALWCWLYIP